MHPRICNLNLYDLPKLTRNRVKTYVYIHSKEIEKKNYEAYIHHKGAEAEKHRESRKFF